MKIQSNSELNKNILNGVNKLADIVGSTLGPKGRTVLISRKGKNPIISKDGVTIADFLELEDPFENIGAQVIKQASSVTATEAGDGTTTSTVLARAIIANAQKYITAGASPVELKRGMDKAVSKVVQNISEISKPVTSIEDIEHIANISANGDKQIGKLIALAVDKVGKDGAVSIEEAKSVDTSLDIVEGFQIPAGYVSPQFITDERRGALKYENAIILVTDYNIDSLDEIMPALEIAARENKPFIIFAENVEGQSLAAMILNLKRGSMKVAAIKAPKYGEERRNILKDLALATGATFITREGGMKLKEVKRSNLGSCKTIEALKNWTTVVGGGGNYKEVEDRIEALKAEIQQTEDIRDCEIIQDRITRLASGIAIIRVGGLTEVDMLERKHRIEDALEAVKSAQQEGILPGGGVGLLRCVEDLEVETDNEDQQFGVEIIRRACVEPIRKLAENCGDSADIIINELTVQLANDPKVGYNFAIGKYVNMYEAGILDPAKVTRCALQNAASAASTLLTTSHAIIEV
jgi:chaperonin GroEL